MTNFQQWRQRNSRHPVNAESRAVTTWQRIQRQPVMLELARGDVDVPVQTVRVTIRGNNRTERGDSGAISQVTGARVVGVQQHPDEPDTDIEKGDIFRHSGLRFQVRLVVRYPGRIEARCEAMS